MSSLDDNLVAIALACCLKVKTRKRKIWSKQWLLKRQKYSHVNLMKELAIEKDDWFNYMRMDHDTYLELLSQVSPLIEKKDTCMREAISPHERLSATLRFLATGRTYSDLKFTTIISQPSLSAIIPETCAAIYKCLGPKYLKFPSTQHEWEEIAKEFERVWNFPHCVGAVDGKHVKIVPPPESGSFYYNYKGFHSMVLMGIANAKYEFILCDFGINGRISDGGVINRTTFYDKLCKGHLNLPQENKIEGSEKVLPYVFIGDEAFAMRTDFLRPFSQKDLSYERRIFNYRLSRACRIIENVFGILVLRFRIFQTAINLLPRKTKNVVLACCALHNFLRAKCIGYSIPDESDEQAEDNMSQVEQSLAGLQRGTMRNTSNAAKKVRYTFMNYFNNEGKVAWQDNV